MQDIPGFLGLLTNRTKTKQINRKIELPTNKTNKNYILKHNAINIKVIYLSE